MDEPCCPSDNPYCMTENSHHSTDNYCYDADASNDSTDLNLSSSHEDSDHNHHHQNNHHQQQLQQQPKQKQQHPEAVGTTDDESTEYHHSGFGEAAARGAKPFIPISEDTVFLDAGAPMPSISTSSPLSGDSWMNYSSNSSDDYSCLSGQLHTSGQSISGAPNANAGSTDESSSDFENDPEAAEPVPKNKRSFEHLIRHSHSGEIDEKDGPSNVVPSAMGQSKRQRGKEPKTTSSNVPISNVAKRRLSTIRRNSSVTTGTQVDIRMIDFAHTAFVRKTGSSQLGCPLTSGSASANLVQHQGPDNGFLRGLDSLKRLLTEILNEDH